MWWLKTHTIMFCSSIFCFQILKIIVVFVYVRHQAGWSVLFDRCVRIYLLNSTFGFNYLHCIGSDSSIFHPLSYKCLYLKFIALDGCCLAFLYQFLQSVEACEGCKFKGAALWIRVLPFTTVPQLYLQYSIISEGNYYLWEPCEGLVAYFLRKNSKL